jgi:hypothetical protein
MRWQVPEWRSGTNGCCPDCGKIVPFVEEDAGWKLLGPPPGLMLFLFEAMLACLIGIGLFVVVCTRWYRF